jgi:hypothetical protein
MMMMTIRALCLFAALAAAPAFAKPVSGPDPAGTLPTEEAALAFATRWRAAVDALDCARSKKDFEVHCTGAELPAAMPPPVWFGVAISDLEHLHESCEAWGKKGALTAVESGPAYERLTVCVAVTLEPRMSAPFSVAPFAKATARFAKKPREQLRALEKTHRFVTIRHAPTSEDPDRFDLVLAITGSDDGKPRLTAMYSRRVVASIDGE